jgi:hypothetical protein
VYKYLIIFNIFWITATGAQAQPVPVLSDGVGIEAQQALIPRQREFNLKLVFTLREGDYVAGVAVKITDGGARVVLEQIAAGPILLVRLPAGRYTATLTHEGVTQTRQFTLRGKGLHSEQVRWARTAADGEPLL